MLIRDGKEFRNLEEQVAKNTSNLADIGSLNLLGIKIVGEIASASELPDPSTYEGSYGDGYMVGNSTDGFVLYVFTRPNTETTTAHWFSLGQFPLPGPQGIQGPAGPQGETGSSTKWYYGINNPVATEGYTVGDMYLRTSNGDLFQLGLNGWTRVANIIGPQGPQGATGADGADGATGPQGPQGVMGPTGTAVHIVGMLATTASLPLPTTLNDLTAAYLVGTDSKHLYIQVGATVESAVWTDMGEFNNVNYWEISGTTLVPMEGADEVEINNLNVVNALMKNGVDVATVDDLSGKLDKVSTSSANHRAYIKLNTGEQAMRDINTLAVGSTIVQRDINGNTSFSTPTADSHAANKKYVDDGFVAKVTSSGYNRVYGINTDGIQRTFNLVDGGASAWSIPLRNASGQIYTATPTADLHATPKSYVDSAVKFYEHRVRLHSDAAVYNGDIYVSIINRTSASYTSVETFLGLLASFPRACTGLVNNFNVISNIMLNTSNNKVVMLAVDQSGESPYIFQIDKATFISIYNITDTVVTI